MEILQSIITPISINVMDSFSLFKKMIKMLFHYKYMFKYITIFIGSMMPWFHNLDISLSVYSPTFPPRTLFTKFRPSAFTRTKDVRVSGGIIIAWMKRFVTSYAIVNRYFAPFWADITIVRHSLVNEFTMATRRASFSLSITLNWIFNNLRTWRAGLTTNNTIYHNNIIPLVTNNIKGVQYVY